MVIRQVSSRSSGISDDGLSSGVETVRHATEKSPRVTIVIDIDSHPIVCIFKSIRERRGRDTKVTDLNVIFIFRGGKGWRMCGELVVSDGVGKVRESWEEIGKNFLSPDFIAIRENPSVEILSGSHRSKADGIVRERGHVCIVTTRKEIGSRTRGILYPLGMHIPILREVNSVEFDGVLTFDEMNLTSQPIRNLTRSSAPRRRVSRGDVAKVDDESAIRSHAIDLRVDTASFRAVKAGPMTTVRPPKGPIQSNQGLIR